MKEKVLLMYNLQFFAEGSDNDDEGDNDSIDDNTPDVDDNLGQNGVDAEAFAELISEKDKKIEELEGEVRKLKKSNAQLTVRLSSGQKTEKTFEENLLGLVGQPARKE